VYEFGSEESYTIDSTTLDKEDFMNEETDDYDPTAEVILYEFGNEETVTTE